MPTTFNIRRFNPEKSPEPYWQAFTVDCEPGWVVLQALHAIHDEQDGALAYRYACRGAICGSCAMRINGAAGLACKTQVESLDASQPITLEPLLNMSVVKDLVVDHEPFFAALRNTTPWLTESARAAADTFTLDETLSKQEKDQFLRSNDCIMCQSCFSDCPKRAEDASFAGPAACLAMFKRIHHPQEPDADARLKAAREPGGVFDCDKHANCVKVCPKDCRPMRAIAMLQKGSKT